MALSLMCTADPSGMKVRETETVGHFCWFLSVVSEDREFSGLFPKDFSGFSKDLVASQPKCASLAFN